MLLLTSKSGWFTQWISSEIGLFVCDLLLTILLVVDIILVLFVCFSYWNTISCGGPNTLHESTVTFCMWVDCLAGNSVSNNFGSQEVNKL